MLLWKQSCVCQCRTLSTLLLVLGCPLGGAIGNVDCHGTYSQALQSPPCVQLLQDVEQVATENNVDAAVQALSGAVEMAADAGGMPAKRSSNKCALARAHQPFFDAERAALKRLLRCLDRTRDILAP
jgi:hypothetical protein